MNELLFICISFHVFLVSICTNEKLQFMSTNTDPYSVLLLLKMVLPLHSYLGGYDHQLMVTVDLRYIHLTDITEPVQR